MGGGGARQADRATRHADLGRGCIVEAAEGVSDQDVDCAVGAAIGPYLGAGEEAEHQLHGRFVGTRYPGLIREVGDTHATIDFNHPLAGKAIRFEVEIIGVN